MAKNKLCDLRDHLFETLEMVKNNNNPEASENEKISVENAETISELAGRIIDSYKIEVQAMQILSKADNIIKITEVFTNSGLISNNIKALAQ